MTTATLTDVDPWLIPEPPAPPDERWREAWRRLMGYLPTAGLIALRGALERDDPELIQGLTVAPEPNFAEVPTGACAIAYPCWKSEGLDMVEEVGARWADVTCRADRDHGPETSTRFVVAYDTWSRADMLAHLLPEVRAELERREGK